MIISLRRIAAIGTFTFCLASCTKDQPPLDPNDIQETLPAVQTAVNINLGTNCGGFYQALPARYDSTTKLYPLLVFLHGVGERGNGTTELDRLFNTPVAAKIRNKQFPPQFTVNGEHFSFIAISPQFKEWPVHTDVEAVVAHVLKTLRVDQTRIYVMGMSMGGGATWEYAAANASKLAAIVPICGASAPDLARAKNIAAANLPVWAFHNTDDSTIPVSYTNETVANINAQNPLIPAIKTISPTGEHNAWDKAGDPFYKENGKNVYEWMLQYTRK